MTEPKRHLPLNALRAFEAAGRLGSFMAAAAELNVTPGAISRQVKTLEDALDIQLFTRGHREVILSDDARRYREGLTDAFRRITRSTDELLNASKRKPMRVMCSINVALRWLLPRLPRFHMAHPGQDVTVTTLPNPQLRRLQFGEADLVIRLGDAEWMAKQDAAELFASELIVVCAPRLQETGGPVRTVADVLNHRLLMSELRLDSWARWLAAVGGPEPDPAQFSVYESSAMSCAAAIEGLGLALGERGLMGEDIRNGRLIQPLAPALRGDESFYVVSAPNPTAQVRELMKWLISEGRRTTAELRQGGDDDAILA